MRATRTALISAIAALLLWETLTGPAAAGPVTHPNLLFNREELAALKNKIETQPWAKALWERELGPDRNSTELLVQSLQYALYGEAAAGEAAKREVLRQVANPPQQWYGGTLDWIAAQAYDLTYDLFTAEERTQVEQALLGSCRGCQRGALRVGPPNLTFICFFQAGIIGCAIGNDEIVDWAINSPGRGPGAGGLKSCLDNYLADGQFWKEATIYGLVNPLPGMILLARAVRHYSGTDLWAYRGKTGGSIRNMIDGCLRFAYPLEQTGRNGGSIRLATYGDGATRDPMLSGGAGDSYIINPPSGTATFDLNGLLEVAYAETKDPAYLWFLSLRPDRGAKWMPGNSMVLLPPPALWYGVDTLPAAPKPPAASSSYFPELGMAFLRSDESSNYWSGGAMGCLMLGSAGYGHDHRDKLHLDLFAKGRLFYNDLMTTQYEPIMNHWSNQGPGHNLVLVDYQSPDNDPSPLMRHEFSPEAKFYSVTAKACFKGVAETRSLVMSQDYLAEFFHLESTKTHTYDYFLHSYGRPYPTEPAAYRPTNDILPQYWWMENERGRSTDRTWSLDFVQRTGGINPGLGWGDVWFSTQVGMRVTMSGAPGTQVYYGDGPLTNLQPYSMLDGNPEPSMPFLVARRQGKSTTFCVVHTPFDMPAPVVRSVTEITGTAGAAGMRIEGANFSDRVMVALMPEVEGAPPQRLTGEGESYTFRQYGYLRITGDGLVARGGLIAFRVQAPAGAERKVVLNGTTISVRRDGDFLVYGSAAPSRAPASAPPPAISPQVNLAFFPVELRLAQNGQGKVNLKIRAATAAAASGTLVLDCPDELTVTPSRITYGPLAEGEEKDVELTVAIKPDVPSQLLSLRASPESSTGAQFFPEELPVSVGVVITEDNRMPRMGDFVVWSPRYKMRVSKTYGNSYYLLDRDGQRRHGVVGGPISLCYGLPSVRDTAVDDSTSTHGQGYHGYVLRWGQDTHSFWIGPSNLTGISAFGGFLYNYRFTPEYIVFEMTQASGKEYQFRLWHLANPPTAKVTIQSGGNADGQGAEKYQWICVDQPPFQDQVLVMTPPQSGLTARAYGSSLTVDFRNMHQGDKMVLGFVRPEELTDAVTRWGQEF